ncbi:MAG: trimethylamine methyltransferase family protein [Pseudomonadota bacterium]
MRSAISGAMRRARPRRPSLTEPMDHVVSHRHLRIAYSSMRSGAPMAGTKEIGRDNFDKARSAMRLIGACGHFRGHPHAQAGFQDAFSMPGLFDNNSLGKSTVEHSEVAADRAPARGQEMSATFVEPKRRSPADEALCDDAPRR